MGFWKTAKLILTLRCEQASRIASQELDGKISKGESCALYLHMLICANCKHFWKQIRWIQTAVQERDEYLVSGSESPDDRLSPEARERIQQALTESPQ